MSPNNRKTASLLVYLCLITMTIVGALALSQTNSEPIGIEESSDHSDQIVKIGAIYNLEGSQSPLDLPSSKGAMLAVKEINALGGIDGKKIELVLCDGKSDPNEVYRCAENLLRDNVSAMMGLSDTDMVIAAENAVSGVGIPFVTSGATSPKLVLEYPDLFLACFGDNVQAKAGAKYAYGVLGLKTCCLLVDGDMEYARNLASDFEDQYRILGGTIVMEAFINGSNLENLTRIVETKNPEMIYLAAGPKGAVETIETIRKAGIISPIFGGDSFDSPELKATGMGCIVFSTHVLLNTGSARTVKFIEVYLSSYGYPPENSFSALGYDTANLLADAIDRADSNDPNAILKALEETSGFKGVTGDISYTNGSHIPKKDVTMVMLTDGDITSSRVVTPD